MIRIVYLGGLEPEVVVREPKKVFTRLVALETAHVAVVICIPVPVSRVFVVWHC